MMQTDGRRRCLFSGKIEAAGRPPAFSGTGRQRTHGKTTAPLVAVKCPAGAKQADRQKPIKARLIPNPGPGRFPTHFLPAIRAELRDSGRRKLLPGLQCEIQPLHNYFCPEFLPAIASLVHLMQCVTLFVHFKMDFRGSFNAVRYDNFPYFLGVFLQSGRAVFGHYS